LCERTKKGQHRYPRYPQENQLDHARQQHYPSLSRVNVGAGQGIIIQCLLDPGKARIQHYPSLLFFSHQPGEQMNLIKLGFRRRPKRTLAELFRPTSPGPKTQLPIRPDVNYPNHDQRTPQAPAYTQMWLDHWSHWGDVKNPVGEPMESGA
jgi:hypothetical protein